MTFRRGRLARADWTDPERLPRLTKAQNGCRLALSAELVYHSLGGSVQWMCLSCDTGLKGSSRRHRLASFTIFPFYHSGASHRPGRASCRQEPASSQRSGYRTMDLATMSRSKARVGRLWAVRGHVCPLCSKALAMLSYEGGAGTQRRTAVERHAAIWWPVHSLGPRTRG